MVCQTFVRLGKCSSCLTEVTFQEGEIDTNYYDQLYDQLWITTLIYAFGKQKGTERKRTALAFLRKGLTLRSPRSWLHKEENISQAKKHLSARKTSRGQTSRWSDQCSQWPSLREGEHGKPVSIVVIYMPKRSSSTYSDERRCRGKTRL